MGLPRRWKCNYIRVVVFVLLILVVYNVSQMWHGDTTAAASDDSSIIEPQVPSDAGAMKAVNLHVVPGMLHKHLLRTVNNSLFSRQGPFLLPEGDEPLLGTMQKGFIFPGQINASVDDRIWHQMRHVPSHIAARKVAPQTKIILLYNGGVKLEDLSSCPVYSCRLTDNRELALRANVILWMHNIGRPFHRRPANQIWAFYFLESPLHTPFFPDFDSSPEFAVNWTATYRSDSTIVAPYFKYTPYDLKMPIPERYSLPKRNYAQKKKKMVAWFVSNCNSHNNRLKIAKELQKYIQVDIYGACGNMRCPRTKTGTCFHMLNRDYKFYLAFENSNCRDYITEKFFLNGLSNDVVPVVMGAHPDDYRRSAPPHSFIHVEDFGSIKKLANQLHYLASNDTAYNEYMAWKGHGLVDTNTFFWCRLCMMAHLADDPSGIPADYRNFPRVNNWWRGSNQGSARVCIGTDRWTR